MRRMPTLADYLQCLRDDAAERHSLFEEVLIPVTSFFREPESYEALKTTILPRLMAGRPPRTPLRVWVPGCASGEEAYSIAICLLEYLGDAAEAMPIKIFATDISERAIEVARAGIYGEGIAAEVSAQRLQRFFLKTDRGYEINKTVRDLCVFARHDLTRDPPFSQLDLVSCRNVLIYLGPVLQDRVLPILHYALKPGGILVLGSSETVGGFTDLFEVVDTKHRFYVRTPTAEPADLRLHARVAPAGSTCRREAELERGRGSQDVFREADRVVLARYAPSGVVVDEDLRVVQFRGDTGPYLKPAAGSAHDRAAADGARGAARRPARHARPRRRDNAPARKEGVRVQDQRSLQDIDLEVIPITDPASGVAPVRGAVRGVRPRPRGRTPAPRPREAVDARGRVGERPGDQPPEPRPRRDASLTCNR